MDSPYRAYVKDCLNLTAAPKVFMTLKGGDPAGDILTQASSSFDMIDKVPEEVREGDVLCVYDPSGKVIYSGVIESKGEKSISTKQIYSFFNQDWFTRVFKEDHLEHEIADIFNDFMTGKIGEIVTALPAANQDNFAKNMNYYIANGDNYDEYRINKNLNDETQEYEYTIDKVNTIAQADLPPLTDSLVTQKFSAFTVNYSDSQEVHLTSDDNQGTARNMEDFIYSLYEDYGVVVEIEIPYSGQCYISIKTANYSSTKIAKNSANIISISPTTKTEETNKLVIMSSVGAYRKTYYATSEGVVDNMDDPNRLPVINTVFVYSDDELEDIKAEHLKDEMYNHELVFTMRLNNKIYDFFSWRLGQPLEVYYKGVYYKTVFTGYSYSFNEGERASMVEITCGKVRERLTDLINRKKI